MSRLPNLLPMRNQIAFIHHRQARVWGMALLVIAIAMAVFFVAVDRHRAQRNQALSLGEESVEPIREAQRKLVSLEIESHSLRQVSQQAESLQLRDAPLALLQSVGDCCHDLGSMIQIDSLRMDEISGITGNGSKSSIVRKQLILVGSAEADYLITRFVGRLNDCGVFRKVELESSLAVADRESTKRTFQIRCQQ